MTVEELDIAATVDIPEIIREAKDPSRMQVVQPREVRKALLDENQQRAGLSGADEEAA